jgi:hypothetical protein
MAGDAVTFAWVAGLLALVVGALCGMWMRHVNKALDRMDDRLRWIEIRLGGTGLEGH